LGVGQGVVGHPVGLKKHPEMVLEKANLVDGFSPPL
jgi:hypothetical protein